MKDALGRSSGQDAGGKGGRSTRQEQESAGPSAARNDKEIKTNIKSCLFLQLFLWDQALLSVAAVKDDHEARGMMKNRKWRQRGMDR